MGSWAPDNEDRKRYPKCGENGSIINHQIYFFVNVYKLKNLSVRII